MGKHDNAIQIPSISLPQGGGAVRGIDEKFQVNSANGTSSFSIPIPVNSARGFAPALSIDYNSGSGNGVFGLGWNLSLSVISRKTDRGIPRYTDDNDVFIIGGVEDLVPELKQFGENEFLNKEGKTEYHERREDGFTIRRYRPRTEGSFLRIERYLADDGTIYWTVTDLSNVTTIYGMSASSRLASPDGEKIYQWYPEFSFDNNGNSIAYYYIHESADDLDISKVYNKNRIINGRIQYSGIYLSEIRYGNIHPYYRGGIKPEAEDYRFITRFIYNNGRADTFSTRKPGFELRTSKLCECIQTINRFPQLPGGEAIVSSIDFEYKYDNTFSHLVSLTSTGYIKHQDNTYTSKSLPPVTFKYQEHTWNSSLETLDVQLGDGFIFTDLYNEGIPGLLSEKDGNWYYMRNLGNGNFSKPLTIPFKPSFHGAQMNLADLEGDGNKQLVNLSFEPRGFFELNDDNSWQPFTQFKSLPTTSLHGDNVRMIDLDGDGRPDILVAENQVFTWYENEGKRGFSSGGSVNNGFNDEFAPCISFNDSTQSVFLADMSGDGLVDIVRVRNRETCYWPNLGYGKFGAKITMENSPVFASDSDFNPSMIRFADIDGSGTSDIIYLGNGKFECWLNSCGASLSNSPYTIDGIPELSMASDINFVDLLGNGTSCMVWSLPQSRSSVLSVKYINLLSGKKPFVMKGYTSGVGKEVLFEYTSSTKYYLEDELNGNPWPEKLPFPIQCLSSVEVTDHVTGSRFLSEYSYHNGHYCHKEKEFRGFGMVEQIDTECFERWKLGENAKKINDNLYQKPIITRTWFNTGSANFNIDIDIPPQFKENFDSESWLEAHRAARGSALKQTVTDSDGNLFSESVSQMKVKLIQPKYNNAHAVFIPLSKGSISYAYECGDLEDPRVSQSLNIKYDDRGNLLESAAIVFPRKKDDSSLPENILKMQKEIHISYSKVKYTNDIDADGEYYGRVPYLNESFILEGLPKSGEFYCAGDFEDIDGFSTLASRSITQFYSKDFRTPAPYGEIQAAPIQYCNYVQAYTGNLLEECFQDKVTAEDMVRGRYVRIPDYDGWWISSGRAILLQEGENEETLKQRFYNALVYESPLGATAKVEYADSEYLMVSSVEDHYGNVAKAHDFDFRTLSPRVVEDINGNFTKSISDELGYVIATAVMGKGDEADTLDGFTDMTSALDESLVNQFFSTKEYTQLESVARKLLRGASSRYLYKYNSYDNNAQPLCCAMIAREEHYSVNKDSRLQISFDYSNAFGEVVLRKVQAETNDGTDSVRWLGNGRTIKNNKGKVVMQYEPYFSNTPEYEDAKEIVETGVTPIFHYDALGRVIRTDYPDGTYSKVEFDQWKTVVHDQIDTVMDSDWLKKKKGPQSDKWEREAAEKSEKLSGTPSTAHYDSMGREVYKLSTDGIHQTTVYDKFGNVERIIDSRDNAVVINRYDMLGNVISIKGMDVGTKWKLMDATGNIMTTWDQRGHIYERHYDVMGRPIWSAVKGGEEKNLNNIVSRSIYGEDLLQKGYPADELKRKNYLGNIIYEYDTSGRSSVDMYDFAGRALKCRFQLASDYKCVVNWTEEGTDNGLEKQEFITLHKYDALGRKIQSVNPDGSVISVAYGRGGMPMIQSMAKSADQTPKSYIKSLVYNEKRQRCRIVYGNDVSVRYDYDPLTLKLVRIFSARKNGDVLQDINYTYDAAGNITHITDKAVPVEFSNNKIISGDSDYTYDIHYRLIKASGRENNAALKATSIQEYNDSRFCSTLSKGDSVGLRNYTELYEYDCVGNMLQMKHISEGNSWTRKYCYSDSNNHLLSTSIGDTISHYSYHPTHGFINSMPHLTCMEWNFRDELAMSSRQASNDDQAEKTYYCYDASGKRSRKITVKGNSIKDERIYLGDFEIYRCHSGLHSGLERKTMSLSDDKGQRYVMIDVRNNVDDGTEKELTRFQLGNNIGSTSIELDDSAEIISYEEYHPYGTTSYQIMSRSIKAAAKRYRYTGMERDDETGLSYHTARYYIPWLGRWLSADPIGIEGGINFYCYCLCSPNSFTDVNGTDCLYDPYTFETICEGGPDDFDYQYLQVQNEELEQYEEYIGSGEIVKDFFSGIGKGANEIIEAIDAVDPLSRVESAIYTGLDVAGFATAAKVAKVAIKTRKAVRGGAITIALSVVAMGYNADQAIKDSRALVTGKNYQSGVAWVVEQAGGDEATQLGVEIGLGVLSPEGAAKVAQNIKRQGKYALHAYGFKAESIHRAKAQTYMSKSEAALDSKRAVDNKKAEVGMLQPTDTVDTKMIKDKQMQELRNLSDEYGIEADRLFYKSEFHQSRANNIVVTRDAALPDSAQETIKEMFRTGKMDFRDTINLFYKKGDHLTNVNTIRSVYSVIQYNAQ